ncbi:MAG: SDR family oxidoreductase [Deltaproteobacteria bacterium]|nr:SDR family oxidoreductase [Deltaproteobacteria bacterium]
MAWFDEFRGKVVVVTGASSGIGRETALAFGAVGARVALVARRREALEKVKRAINQRGGEAVVVPTDVTKRNAVRANLRAVYARWGRIDVVVNSASVLISSPVLDLKPGDLTAMLNVNLFGALFVMQEAVQLMQRQGSGCIVNMASLAGRRGMPPLGGYCATKFALVGITEALRAELHGSDIHVALVMPSVTDTPMAHNPGLRPLWPGALSLPHSWMVWAVFAAARFQLIDISVPPSAATLEKLAALVPGLDSSAANWGESATQWLSNILQQDTPRTSPGRRA